MRSTIKDVARAANVSPSTVSLVINKRPASISEETRMRVLRAAAELRYRPNKLAASLVTKNTRTFGLIVPDISNIFHTTYCEEINLCAEKRGYSTIIRIAQNDVEETIRFLYDFEDRSVEGIILTKSVFKRPEDTAACMQAVRELYIPVMLTDRVPVEHIDGAVLPNDYLGGYLAVQHLIDMGHRQIGCITGPLHYRNCTERLRGCRQALETAGISYDPALVVEGKFDIASGANSLSYLLGQKVTAIFAFNDMIAYGVYKQARIYNLRIPADISIVGFDDLAFSDLIEPPLTTLEYPMKRMAEAVVDRMVKKIGGEDVPAGPIVCDPVLKVKGSTIRRRN